MASRILLHSECIKQRNRLFVYGADYYLNQEPEVWSTVNAQNRHKAVVTGVFLTGLNAAETAILKPGEAISCYSAGLALGKNQVSGRGQDKDNAGMGGVSPIWMIRWRDVYIVRQ